MSTIGTLVGYPVLFHSRSELLGGAFYEEIDPSAAGDLDLDDQFGAVSHDYTKVFSRKSAGTLRLTPDAKGIRATSDLPNTSFARDLLESHGRRDVPGWSFGMRVLEDRWGLASGSTPLRTVTRMRVFEISAGVATPAYSATATTRGAAYASSASPRRGLNDSEALLACYEFLRNVHASRDLKLQMRGLYYGSTPHLVEVGIERRVRCLTLAEARLQLARDAF